MLEKIYILFLSLATILIILGMIIESDLCRYVGLSCLILCNVINLYRLSRKKKEE